MNNLQKEQIIKEYIEFKELCVKAGLFDIDEILGLFFGTKKILGDLINGN